MPVLDHCAEKIFLPLLDRWRGNKAALFRNEVRSIIDQDAELLRAHQLNRLREMARYAAEHCTFYQERFAEAGFDPKDDFSFEDYSRLPALTKTDIRLHAERLTSKQFTSSELRQSATGGTTSSPVKLYMDWNCCHRRWAATYEFDRRIGFRRGHKIAYLWGAAQDFANTTSWRSEIVNKLSTRAIYLPSSPLDDASMERYFRRLKSWRPRFLQAYPTPLTVFAKYLLENKLELDIPGISVTAEPLLEHQAETIEAAFGVKPYNWYGARECGRIATECSKHCGMHVNSYGLYVEVENENETFAHGMGKIIITDLWNFGMPMIRYEIGDIGTISDEACECGSHLPRIVRMDGRTTDIFENSKGQKIPGVAFTNRIVKDNEEFQAMQFIQVEIQEFEVLVVPGEKWQNENSIDKIRSTLNEFMQEEVHAKVKLVDEIPKEASGKVRFCKSLLNA